jgi:hexosaminidase
MPVFPSFVPAPRSVQWTGDEFPLASLDLSIAPAFLAVGGRLRADLAGYFGAAVLAPASGEEEFVYAEGRFAFALPELGGNFKRAAAPSGDLALIRDASLAPGAFTLTVAAPTVTVARARLTLAAADAEGAAAAVATLLQLLLQTWDGWRWRLPSVRVADAPAFAWRGLMVDSARHFLPVADLERLIRLAALYRINRLHWHLSDDQGWRIELLSVPGATASGSTRLGPDPARDGFYSQDEARRVIAFAAGYGITIVPELDLPGHVQAVLAGDPDLGCADGPFAVRSTWGIAEDVLCMGNPRSLEFALAAWDEVAALFPGPYVHIGGDECPTTRWEACPRCAAAKDRLGLAEWVDLHSDFVKTVAGHLAAKGKTVFGWDEVLDSKLDNGANVVHWRQWEPGLAARALERGRDLIRSPSFPYYFDFVQADDRLSSPGLSYKVKDAATARRVYEFDPGEGLPAGAASPAPGRGRLLGVQANVWSEFIRDPRRLDYMVFPRLLALAETAWLGPDRPGWDDFAGRLAGQRRVLDRLGVNYCPIAFEG